MWYWILVVLVAVYFVYLSWTLPSGIDHGSDETGEE